MHLVARHLPASSGAMPTGRDAFIHAANFFAIRRAGLADFGANLANPMLEMRATQLEISRGLANFGAIHQQAEMFGFDVFTAGLEAVVHGGLQADLITTATSFDTGLHGVFDMG